MQFKCKYGLIVKNISISIFLNIVVLYSIIHFRTNGKYTDHAHKNETDEILRNFDLGTDYRIPARRPNQVLIKKKKLII